MKTIFLINCRKPMIDAFKKMGFEVKAIYTSDRTLDLPAKLTELNYSPDLVLQQEVLGKRLFLQNLSEVDCLKIFWSVDTHLNMHWHGLYGSLFDGVLTTQKKYVSSLQLVCSAEICWVPWMGARPGPEIGTSKGIVPYQKRKFDLTFVGRVSKERRSRQWFVDFLNSAYDLNLVDGLSYAQMMETYRQTRIVPNEAIFGEVNFRLFEACSCGCSMVTPDIGSELGELFEIDREIKVYSNVLELKEILDFLHARPDTAAKMALAGYERILRDHLPENRSAAIIEFAVQLTGNEVNHAEEKLIQCLIQATLGEGGDSNVDWEWIIRTLLSLDSGLLRDTALLRIFSLKGGHELFLNIARPYMQKNLGPTDCLLFASASLGALRLKMWDVAKHFCCLWMQGHGRGKSIVPADPVNLLVFWGDELLRCGHAIRSGVSFNEKKDIPACAADCYFAALYKDPDRVDVFGKLETVFSDIKGAEPSRLGFLSHLSLHRPEDWRISAELGIVNLKCFRLAEGIRELEGARNLAVAAGRERFFDLKIKSDLPGYSRLVTW